MVFALAGLRVRADPGRRRSTISVRRPDLSTAPMRRFDQTGGAAEEAPVDEWSQTQANLRAASGTGLRSPDAGCLARCDRRTGVRRSAQRTDSPLDARTHAETEGR